MRPIYDAIRYDTIRYDTIRHKADDKIRSAFRFLSSGSRVPDSLSMALDTHFLCDLVFADNLGTSSISGSLG